MDCEQARAVLTDYLLEEVSSEDREQIQRHLQSCPTCAEQARQLRQTVGQLVQGEGFEEIPQRIRLVAEPVSWRAAFWRHSGQLAFAATGLACVAIALLALFRTTVSYQQGQWQIAFGVSPAVPAPPVVPTVRNALPSSRQAGSGQAAVASTTPEGISRAEIWQLVADAVAASETRQQHDAARLAQTVARQAEERRLRDWREMAESLRYFQAAQVTIWKEQVQNQQYVSALMRQAGMDAAPQP